MRWRGVVVRPDVPGVLSRVLPGVPLWSSVAPTMPSMSGFALPRRPRGEALFRPSAHAVQLVTHRSARSGSCSKVQSGSGAVVRQTLATALVLERSRRGADGGSSARSAGSVGPRTRETLPRFELCGMVASQPAPPSQPSARPFKRTPAWDRRANRAAGSARSSIKTTFCAACGRPSSSSTVRDEAGELASPRTRRLRFSARRSSPPERTCLRHTHLVEDREDGCGLDRLLVAAEGLALWRVVDRLGRVDRLTIEAVTAAVRHGEETEWSVTARKSTVARWWWSDPPPSGPAPAIQRLPTRERVGVEGRVRVSKRIGVSRVGGVRCGSPKYSS